MKIQIKYKKLLWKSPFLIKLAVYLLELADYMNFISWARQKLKLINLRIKKMRRVNQDECMDKFNLHMFCPGLLVRKALRDNNTRSTLG